MRRGEGGISRVKEQRTHPLAAPRSRRLYGALTTLRPNRGPEDSTMIDRLHSLPDRALDLASQVGDGFKHLVPDGAGK